MPYTPLVRYLNAARPTLHGLPHIPLLPKHNVFRNPRGLPSAQQLREDFERLVAMRKPLGGTWNPVSFGEPVGTDTWHVVAEGHGDYPGGQTICFSWR